MINHRIFGKNARSIDTEWEARLGDHYHHRWEHKTLNHALLTAGRAQAIQFEFVSRYLKSVSRGHLLLQPFDITILEFYDLATVCADEMIVVPLVRHIIVLRLAAEVARLSEAGVAEQVHCPINRGKADMVPFLCQHQMHLIGGDMFHFEKSVQDNFSLFRQFELMLGEMVLQAVDLFDLGAFDHEQASPGSTVWMRRSGDESQYEFIGDDAGCLLKTKTSRRVKLALEPIHPTRGLLGRAWRRA